MASGRGYTQMISRSPHKMREYLCVFAQEHVDFRMQELLAICEGLRHEIQYESSRYSSKSPFLVIRMLSDQAVKEVAKRSVLIRGFYELWAVGTSYQELEASFGERREDLNQYFSEDVSFRLRMDCFNKKCSLARQKAMLERVEFLPFKGKVNLKSPNVSIHLHEDYGPSPNDAPQDPYMIYLGRHVAEGQRHLMQAYDVRHRHFIANTSMDAQLSFIMANMAMVKSGDLVCDPFVGSGSILIGCAYFGGFVVGADINKVLLHGRGRPSRSGTNQKWRGPDESIQSNLVQYGLQERYVDVLASDISTLCWQRRELFDAIVTDPPYGVREGARKLGRSKPAEETAGDKDGSEASAQYPLVQSCSLSGVYKDLLEFAANYLVLGGRLVFWLPIVKHEYDPANLPSHPSLRTVANSEQGLGGQISRRLLTMQKIQSSLNMKSADTCGVVENFRSKYFKFLTSKDSTYSPST